MKKYILTSMALLSFIFLQAQVKISGTVTDENFQPLSGADVILKGTSSGTNTDFDGVFELQVTSDPPFQLVVSFVGYETQEVRVTGSQSPLRIVLQTDNSMLNEVVISASRVEERLMESPVTVEKLDQRKIKMATSVDYFDDMAKLKGVTSASGSMTFNTINTRGFSGLANTRFVQLVDGIDNSAPLLNFPMGNLIGIGETDIKDIELVPGAASALYGPNAFNGIMLMNSLTPFDKEGLTVAVKGGFSKASNDKANPIYGADLRYAQTFGKFGIKITGSYFDAKDWKADDYKTDIVTGRKYSQDPFIDPSLPGGISPGDRPLDFDGINTYGDEGVLSSVPLGALQMLDPATAEGIINGVALNPEFSSLFPSPEAAVGFVAQNFQYLPTVDIRRTGISEEELLDNNKATSGKATLSLHYKPNDDIELSYMLRAGIGNAVYQGSERYALRDFTTFSNKLEATGKNFMFRTYMTQTDAGDSYNLTPLGSYTSEYLYGTAGFGNQPGWAGVYLGNFVGALMGGALMNGINVGELIAANPQVVNMAHAGARLGADAMMPERGSAAFQEGIETIRKTLFQSSDPANRILGGAGFRDKSRMFHTEGTYDFSSLLNDELNVLVGANHRLYSLYTYGTVFNEDPDGTGDNSRISINEFGGFVQVSKAVLENHLRLTGSIRYDKNENFEGIFSPRLSAVATLGEKRQHNIRMSYQTGFRNPDTQAQFIFFPASHILLGGAKSNAERYGIYEGGAFTEGSFNRFRASALAGNPDQSLLQEANIHYVQPEKLSNVEVGYKGVIDKLYIDWNFYYNWYKDFLSQTNVVPKVATSQKGQPLYGVADFISSGGANLPAVFRPYYNQNDRVESWGSAIGLSYNIGSGYMLNGNYSYMDFKAADKEKESELDFNSPKHLFNLGVGNNNFAQTGVGFNVNYRWQSKFDWVSSFGSGVVDSYNTLDASAFYTVKSWKTTFKLAGTNLVGPSYRTNIGGPFIGKMITLGVTYDTGF